MPLYLHPPSDCAKMCVCVFVSGCLSECVVEHVCFPAHGCVAHFVCRFVVFSVSPIDVWCGGCWCVPSVVHQRFKSVYYSADYWGDLGVFEHGVSVDYVVQRLDVYNDVDALCVVSDWCPFFVRAFR